MKAEAWVDTAPDLPAGLLEEEVEEPVWEGEEPEVPVADPEGLVASELPELQYTAP